jgi:hypothetical protein
MRIRAIAVLLAAAIVAPPAWARVARVDVERVEPFADGAVFGATGAYERVIGRVHGELDPADARNAAIAGLAGAPRNAAGLVEYEADLFLLRPKDASHASGRLLVDVPNRGNKFVLHYLDMLEVPSGGYRNDPSTAADAGDGLLLRRGYTIAWIGWDPDAPEAAHMGLRAPHPVGRVVQEIRDEFVSGTRGPALKRFALSYPVGDPTGAVLTVRRREQDPERVLDASAWRFGGGRSVELLPAGTLPEAGSIYEFTYRATDPAIGGIGFAAVRDATSFLRSDAASNPARGIRVTLGFGVSQSGRFLRDFLAHGFNQDEAGRRVFDGVLSYIAGIGEMFLNQPFAQPGRTRTQHEDHTMPENIPPFVEAAHGVVRGDAFDPVLIEANSSTEYWQKGASLLGTDAAGEKDVAPPANVRLFLIAGTQHTGKTGSTPERGPCANERNPHNPAPALRALLVALDGWAGEGTAPPASRIPTIAAHTLVPPEKLRFPVLPEFAVAGTPDAIDPPGDWVHPKRVPSPYRVLVPQVDDDGNEVGGLRLPDIAVPIGTYTGWNLYAPPYPEGELCDRDGSFSAIARFEADRTISDPRASLALRYASPDRYVAAVEAAARQLVADRLMLEEDVARYVAAAKEIRF